MMRQVRAGSVAALFAACAAGCTLVGFPAPVPAPVSAETRIVPDLPPVADATIVRDLPANVDPSPPPARIRTYQVLGRSYTTLASSEDYAETGLASWYGDEFQGRPTASGERFDMYALTAAHRTLPLG